MEQGECCVKLTFCFLLCVQLPTHTHTHTHTHYNHSQMCDVQTMSLEGFVNEKLCEPLDQHQTLSLFYPPIIQRQDDAFISH